ncbi:MAG: hypothetical protein HRF50_06530 [Phycisphaerae bacterium]
MQGHGIQFAAVLVSAALVALTGWLGPAIDDGRRALNLMGSAQVKESVPPEYAFAIQAFGAFRGLITNIAFIRAEKYKEKGRFYDAMQLASWICKLQPRFPTVWEFQSWNMAWNISVTTFTPEERWNWVYNGAKLIRDEGLRYNPRAVNLYKQLAWIFVNKMSESVDEFHLAYKRQWAWRMHLLLGPPPDPLGDYRPDKPFEALDAGKADDLLAKAAAHAREQRDEKRRAEENARRAAEGLDPLPSDAAPPSAPDGASAGEAAAASSGELPFEIVKRAAAQRILDIASAPHTLRELYERVPGTREIVEQLRSLGVQISDDPLTEDDYWRDQGLAFTFFYRYRVLSDPPSMLSRVLREKLDDPLTARLDDFDRIVGVRAGTPAGAALVRFLQRKVLLEVYKLDPKKMADLMILFGPMDWRVVDAHSLYWTNEGLIAADESITKFTNDKVNTLRLVFFSLHNLFYRNRLVFEPYTRDVNLAYLNYNPDLNFIEPMHQAYLRYAKEWDPRPEASGVGETFRTGHINFLSEALRLLYFAGREREAERYYEYLRETYGRNPDGTINRAYAKPLRDYVIDGLRETQGGWKDVRAAIYGSTTMAFSSLASGNLALYNELISFAMDQHAQFNAGKLDERVERLRLPPFREMQADALRDWLEQPAISPAITVEKARLWAYLPTYLRQAVYDDLFELFEKECDNAGFELASAFPEPPGMEAYRAQAGREAPQRKLKEGQKKVDTPIQPNQ